MRPAFFLELRTLTCGGSQRHPWPPRRFCATCMIHRFMVSEWCWRKWRRLWNGLSLDLTSHSYTSLIHVHSACCTVWHWHHNILRTSTIVLGQVWWPLPPETQTAAARQEVVHTSFSGLEQHAITVLTYDLQVDTKNMRFSPCLRARCHGLLCQSACSWKGYERLFCMDFPVLQSDDSCNTASDDLVMEFVIRTPANQSFWRSDDLPICKAERGSGTEKIPQRKLPSCKTEP